MMVSIVVFLLFMMGLFGLKQNASIPVLILPLLVICVIFWHNVNQVFAKQSAALTFSSCTKLRDLDADLIQVNKNIKCKNSSQQLSLVGTVGFFVACILINHFSKRDFITTILNNHGFFLICQHFPSLLLRTLILF